MTLAEYKSASKAMLLKLQPIIQRLQSNIEKLDSEFPSWKEKRAAGTDYTQHDARREVLVTLKTVLENAFLSYIFLRDCVTNEAWWSDKLTGVTIDKKVSVAKEQAIMIKWFLFHAIVMSLEETLRAIVRSVPDTFGVRPDAPYQRIYQRILKTSNLRQFESLFDVLRLTRNTLHTNGLFFPDNNKDRTITYKNYEFIFQVGKPLTWFIEEKLIWLVERIREAVVIVIRVPAISLIEHVPRGQSIGI